MYKLYGYKYVYHAHSGLRSPRAHDRDNRQSHTLGRKIYFRRLEMKNECKKSLFIEHYCESRFGPTVVHAYPCNNTTTIYNAVYNNNNNNNNTNIIY